MFQLSRSTAPFNPALAVFQAANEARIRQQDALATAKHDSRAAAYWKGATGRAHHAVGTNALQQTAQARLASSHAQVP